SHEKILGLCRTPHIVAVLDDLAEVLWKDPDHESRGWARDRLKVTLGHALLEACLQLCPHFNSGDLILDIHAGPRSLESPQKPTNQGEIWITESTLGGGGVIEEILRSYASDPRGFFQLAETALEPSDFEIVDSEITRLLELTRVDTSVIAAINEFRMAYGNDKTRDASQRLRKALSNAGVLCTHAVMTALNARILRPGSNSATDEFLYRLISHWREEEERLGIEIDARVYAYVLAEKDKTLDAAFRDYGLPAGAGVNWRFNTVYGLLWPRGNSVQARALSSYNPFANHPDSDRELLLDILRTAEDRVILEEQDWREQVTRRLEQKGVVSLFAKAENLSNLKLALLDLAGNPIQLGFLQLYPQVEGFFREPRGYVTRLKLREAVQ
ncbi:MAG TPA: hypothetical protein VJT15_20770, partial [Pyrinomonadaceae bacterium]|nr:hypothetical protein [Pyrinomonadaceae bacterium]